jgi:hypothetical protein
MYENDSSSREDRVNNAIAAYLQAVERGEKLAVDHAISHVFTREAVVPERKLLTEALKRGIGCAIPS